MEHCKDNKNIKQEKEKNRREQNKKGKYLKFRIAVDNKNKEIQPNNIPCMGWSEAHNESKNIFYS